MDVVNPYEQDDQAQVHGGPMDTTPIVQALSADIMSSSYLSDPTLVQDPMAFVGERDLVAPGQIGALYAMDALDPVLAPVASAYVPEIVSMDPYTMASPVEALLSEPRTLSASPPQLVPSPASIHAVASYSAAAPVSLEPVGVDPHSRTTASMTPPAHITPFSSLSPQVLPGSVVSPIASDSDGLEGAISHQQPQTVIGQLLKDIAKTAMDAGDAFEHRHEVNKVGELKKRINHVMDLISKLSVGDSSGSVNATILPGHILSMDPIVASLGLDDALRLGSKRGLTDPDQPRSMKVLKREPQEDTPLSLSGVDPALSGFATVPVPVSYSVPQVPAPSLSRPPSRPSTPPAVFGFAPVKPQGVLAPNFTYGQPSAAPGPLSLSGGVPPSYPSMHGSWSDSVVPTRHHHSLSAGAIPGSLVGLPTSPTTVIPNPMDSFVPSPSSAMSMGPPSLPQPVSAPPTAALPGHLPRSSRSGSVNGMAFNQGPYSTFPTVDMYSDWRNITASTPRRAGQSNWYMGSDSSRSKPSASAPNSNHNTPPSDDEDDDDDSDSDDDHAGRAVTASADRPATSSGAIDLPPEYRKDVDRIFFEFLNKLCSNLDATDSKGEQIHQTLMAKKMQRLDESPDFRPFKFRIQAFTLAFLDELARQGYPEDKIPMKKVRNYLWRQNYILRFNEDGKKAKSKGNHIWNVEAKKAGDGQWEFRPFHRKLAGTPPSVAYCGLRWSWKPHIWDPQCSFKKIPVTYSSPSLPPWLAWNNGELSGIPPPDAESTTITAVAKFSIDGQEGSLNHTFTVSIAPVSALDSAPYPRSRRSSLIGEPPKRSTSDSILFAAPQRVNARATRVDDTRVIRVLQNVAQRVTNEAESQFVSSSPPKQGQLQDLVKQKHVLEQTVDAYDKALSGQGHVQSRRLAVAAQHVVISAAQAVMADRAVATGVIPIPQAETTAMQSVSVSELTDTTQDAIAMAVKMNGTASNEVDIIVTATSILKSRTPLADSPPATVPPVTPVRPTAVPVQPSRLSSAFPPSSLSTLPEY